MNAGLTGPMRQSILYSLVSRGAEVVKDAPEPAKGDPGQLDAKGSLAKPLQGNTSSMV